MLTAFPIRAILALVGAQAARRWPKADPMTLYAFTSPAGHRSGVIFGLVNAETGRKALRLLVEQGMPLSATEILGPAATLVRDRTDGVAFLGFLLDPAMEDFPDQLVADTSSALARLDLHYGEEPDEMSPPSLETARLFGVRAIDRYRVEVAAAILAPSEREALEIAAAPFDRHCPGVPLRCELLEAGLVAPGGFTFLSPNP